MTVSSRAPPPGYIAQRKPKTKRPGQSSALKCRRGAESRPHQPSYIIASPRPSPSSNPAACTRLLPRNTQNALAPHPGTEARTRSNSSSVVSRVTTTRPHVRRPHVPQTAALPETPLRSPLLRSRGGAWLVACPRGLKRQPRVSSTETRSGLWCRLAACRSPDVLGGYKRSRPDLPGGARTLPRWTAVTVQLNTTRLSASSGTLPSWAIA